MPPLQRSPADHVFTEACTTLGYHPFPLAAAIASVPFKGRNACVYCGFCVEACPFDALTMTPGYELASYDRGNLLWDKERLLVPGTTENDQNMHWIMSGIEKMGKTPPSAWPRAAQDIGAMDDVPEPPAEPETAEADDAEKVPAGAGSATAE